MMTTVRVRTEGLPDSYDRPIDADLIASDLPSCYDGPRIDVTLNWEHGYRNFSRTLVERVGDVYTVSRATGATWSARLLGELRDEAIAETLTEGRRGDDLPDVLIPAPAELWPIGPREILLALPLSCIAGIPIVIIDPDNNIVTIRLWPPPLRLTPWPKVTL